MRNPSRPPCPVRFRIDKSSLVRLVGFSALLMHGDTTVLDRWLWLKRRLPKTANGESLLDAGCGNGVFTIGAARRGYRALGLTHEGRDCTAAKERALLCNTEQAAFETLDLRQLDGRRDLAEKFDVVICLETIEHVLDDLQLVRGLAACLRPGGHLLLTTPNYHYRAITPDNNGPFSKFEDGRHVRRGYTRAMLAELCAQAGLTLERRSFCTGLLSQKATLLFRLLSRAHPLLGWAVILPLRALPPLLDRPITSLLGWPYFSICLEAYKPRYVPMEAQGEG